MEHLPRWVIQCSTLNAIVMGHFARAQVTTPCDLPTPMEGSDWAPEAARIRTLDPLVIGRVALLLYWLGESF